MIPELGTSTIQAGEFSNLERQLYSEEKISSERESFWSKAGKTAKHVLDLYFKPKSFERSGKVYEALGIRQFKKFMINGDYMNDLQRKINPNHKLISDENSLKNYEIFTKILEGGHVGLCGLMSSKIIDRLADGDYEGAAISTVLNTIINVYPIMLQRYNRARIYNVLDRVEKKIPATSDNFSSL